MRVYRYDSSMAAIGATNGTDANAPTVIPIQGKRKVRARIRAPLGPCKLDIQFQLKANSTLVTVATLDPGAAGTEADTGVDGIAVGGAEIMGLVLTNLHSATQKPEVLVEVDDDDAA